MRNVLEEIYNLAQEAIEESDENYKKHLLQEIQANCVELGYKPNKTLSSKLVRYGRGFVKVSVVEQ